MLSTRAFPLRGTSGRGRRWGGLDGPLASLDKEDAYVWALRETRGEDTAGGA